MKVGLGIRRISSSLTWTANSRNVPVDRSELRWMLEKLSINVASTYFDKSEAEQETELNKLVNSLNMRQKHRLESWIHARLASHRPLQYILGTQPFAGLDLFVRKPTLIPRWETEEWTLRCVKVIEKNEVSRSSPINILDLCSGSGCIGLAIAHHIPHTNVLGVDNSVHAIKLASVNARRANLHSRVKFMQLDFLRISDTDAAAQITTRFTHVFDNCSSIFPPFDYVVSNPPYISFQEYGTLDPSVREWEDRAALVGPGEDGAGFYPVIAQIARILLASKKDTEGRVFLEIGGKEQVELVTNALSDSGFSTTPADIWVDLAKNIRVVVGR
ncbi:hypothetical protein HK100_000091 [Physocladia obscura]|uniref:Methyltransferase domain-containing protein n=1 Tax=Physocladia obscura TaxID=109957 RepID=A0AAD5XKF6_9FUNG|nr:hypothetical protein HK100_000091 [Physocladia obscura]